MLRSVFLNRRNVICFAKLKAVTGSSIEDILQELNTSPFYLCMVEIIELMWADLFTENVKFSRFLMVEIMFGSHLHKSAPCPIWCQ